MPVTDGGGDVREAAKLIAVVACGAGPGTEGLVAAARNNDQNMISWHNA